MFAHQRALFDKLRLPESLRLAEYLKMVGSLKMPDHLKNLEPTRIPKDPVPDITKPIHASTLGDQLKKVNERLSEAQIEPERRRQEELISRLSMRQS